MQRPPQGAAAYSFELPPGLGFQRALVEFSYEQQGLIAKYTSAGGAVITAAPASPDFVKQKREGVLPSRQKVLKYQLGEVQDDLECMNKVQDERGLPSVMHRWFRVLRSAGGPAYVLSVELPQDNFDRDGPLLEPVLRSFRLGAGSPGAS